MLVVVLVLSRLLHFFVPKACNEYTTCGSCTQNPGCRFCRATSTCQNRGTTCGNSDLPFTSISFLDRCTSTNGDVQATSGDSARNTLVLTYYSGRITTDFPSLPTDTVATNLNIANRGDGKLGFTFTFSTSVTLGSNHVSGLCSFSTKVLSDAYGVSETSRVHCDVVVSAKRNELASYNFNGTIVDSLASGYTISVVACFLSLIVGLLF